ncbi:unnamed protein product [Arctogadus glacialis]
MSELSALSVRPWADTQAASCPARPRILAEEVSRARSPSPPHPHDARAHLRPPPSGHLYIRTSPASWKVGVESARNRSPAGTDRTDPLRPRALPAGGIWVGEVTESACPPVRSVEEDAPRPGPSASSVPVFRRRAVRDEPVVFLLPAVVAPLGVLGCVARSLFLASRPAPSFGRPRRVVKPYPPEEQWPPTAPLGAWDDASCYVSYCVEIKAGYRLGSGLAATLNGSGPTSACGVSTAPPIAASSSFVSPAPPPLPQPLLHYSDACMGDEK